MKNDRTTLRNMYDTHKRFVSKRHSRRIITDNTEIDIAGCLQPISDYHTVDTFSKHTFHLDVNNKNTANVDICNAHSNNTVHIDTTILGDHDKFYEHNIQENSNNCDDPVTINSIPTENHKSFIKEVDKNYSNNEKKLINKR